MFITSATQTYLYVLSDMNTLKTLEMHSPYRYLSVLLCGWMCFVLFCTAEQRGEFPFFTDFPLDTACAFLFYSFLPFTISNLLIQRLTKRLTSLFHVRKLSQIVCVCVCICLSSCFISHSVSLEKVMFVFLPMLVSFCGLLVHMPF